MAEESCTCPDDAEAYSSCSVHVGCDERCGALENPTTPEEIAAALVHWKEHSWLSGCSHAC